MKKKLLFIIATIIITLQSCISPAFAIEKATKSQLVEYEKGIYISEKHTYIPDGYENFIAFKNYSGKHTIAYFNDTFKVRQNANYNEILGNFEFITFDTIEELQDFCKKGGNIELQKSNRLLIEKSESGIYAMNQNIKISENEVWLKKSYDTSKRTFAELTAKEMLEKTINELLEILKILVPILMLYIAVRKAIEFILNIIRGT